MHGVATIPGEMAAGRVSVLTSQWTRRAVRLSILTDNVANSLEMNDWPGGRCRKGHRQWSVVTPYGSPPTALVHATLSS